MTAWRQGPGGLTLAVAGAEVVCRPAGALWLEAEAALVVADLHLEKGSAFATRGQLLPPYDTGDTLGRLEAEVAALDPRLIVLLGDSFHDGGGEGRLGPRDATRLTVLARGRSLVWILGNHDRVGPHALPGETLATLYLAGLLLTHEPALGPARGEVAGHLHPCARVAGVGGSVRRRCFVTDGERLILPAFGAYAGGLNVRDGAICGLLGRARLAVVLGRSRVHAVPWKALRGD
ncbi:MAG TPA: ligase-associated DNA damage response endonuclease PdeM [Caulobacteraceae bacterium]